LDSRKKALILLNKANKAEFKKIWNIGDKIANDIMKYRENKEFD